MPGNKNLMKLRVFRDRQQVAGLPTLALSGSAADYQTIQLVFSVSASYSTYWAVLDGDSGNPVQVLTATKQVVVKIPTATYDIYIYGKTSLGVSGPSSNTISVDLPDNPGSIDPGTTARMADSFVDSIGTNVLLNQQNVASIHTATYWTTVKPIITGLGIRRIRATVNKSNANFTSQVQELVAAGIKFDWIMNFVTATGPDITQIASNLAWVKNTASVLGGTAHIESLNEVNNRSVTWSSTITFAQIAQKAHDYQAELYRQIRADSSFNSIPVMSFSEWGRLSSMCDAEVTYNSTATNKQDEICDLKPFHGYPEGRKPTVLGVPSDVSEGGGDGEYTLTAALADAGRTVRSNKPVVITEMGWKQWSYPHVLNCTTAEIGDTAHGGVLAANVVNQATKAKYSLRLHCESWLRGLPVCYEFALFNNWNQRPNYGTYNQNKHTTSANMNNGPPYTFTLTAQYTAMQRMISLLSDPGASFTPGALNYSFSGAAVDNDLHHFLLQKRNGHFFIVAWYDKGESWKRASPYGAQDLSVNATLAYGATVASVIKWTPATSASSSAVGTTVSSSSVTVLDHPTIFEITP